MKSDKQNQPQRIAARGRKQKPHVLQFIDQQIIQLVANNRLGTASNYQRTRNSLGAFLHEKDIPFRALNEELVEQYNIYLKSRGLLRNSISFYMRVLRAVYNKAAELRYARPGHPFRKVYTGIDHTCKRAVTETVIKKLNRINLPSGSQIELARDLFIFSYCTRGMAFVDMVHLRKSEVRENSIRYARRKTHQPLFIYIEPPIRQLIDKYMKQNNKSPYLFPILKGGSPKEEYIRYRSALNLHNRSLRKLAEMLPGRCHLSSYSARHSWATAARNRNIPIAVISAALGHTSERTTETYLASMENSVVDAANRLLLRSL